MRERTMHEMLRDQRKPTVREVLPYVQALYAREGGGAGCCLHILLDDGNVDQSSADFCYGVAVGREHQDCEDLARLIRRMSATQRHRLYMSPHCKEEEPHA